MQVTAHELREWGFESAGSVIPDPLEPLRCEIRGTRRYWKGLFRVDVSRPIDGPVMYFMTVDDEVKKVGIAGTGRTKASMFKPRMRSEFGCLREFIDQIRAGYLNRQGECLSYRASLGERPIRFEEDFPWKHRVPLALLASVTVQFWVRAHDGPTALKDDETMLNLYFRGEWANEGWEKVNGEWTRAAVPSQTEIADARVVLDRYQQRSTPLP